MAKIWINSLKLAIVNEDKDKVAQLYRTLPDFNDGNLTMKDLREAQALMAQAIEVLKNGARETQSSMSSIKASIAYQKNIR